MKGMTPERVSRIGIIGDVHAEDHLLAEALNYLRARPVDAILCTGDIVDGAGDASRCCALLADYGALTVRGNHDRWLFENTLRTLPEATSLDALTCDAASYLKALPATCELSTTLGLLLLCHGLSTDDMAKVGPDDYGYALATNDALQALLQDTSLQLVVNGHSHRKMVRELGALTIINAGTLCRDHQPGFLVLDCDAFRVEMLTWHAGTISIESTKPLRRRHR